MKPLRTSLAVLTLSAASVTAGFFGFNILQNSEFARAQQVVEATRQQLSVVNDLSAVFRQVGRIVEPSVVNIKVTKTIKGIHRRLPFDNDMLRRFFRDQEGNGQPDTPDDQTPNGGGGGDDEDTFKQIGTGSGVVMDVSGGNAFILTNNHVAGGATEMEVTLADGRVFKNAKLVGADPKTDLAVVKIPADHIIPAKWGNSDELVKGDWIMAFGSPFGYVGSMTHGIISALHRTDVGILGPMGYENFIQVDAPINPGNSGGPLVNVRGEVIGINTAIASRTGGFQGIGFAIPSNLARTVYTSLKATGKVTRGWLGVTIANVSDEKVQPIVKSFGYQGTKGVFIQDVSPNTPASGKLRAGDVVTKLNGRDLEDTQDLRNAIAATAPGTDVTLNVFRDGKFQDVAIKVGNQPENLAAAMGRGGQNPDAATNPSGTEALGIRLATPTPELAQRYGLGTANGALVTAVAPRSPAARAGIAPGDLITRVDKQDVTSAEQAGSALGKADLKKGVVLYVVSRDTSRFVFVQSEGE